MKHHQAIAALRDAFTELYRVEETARTVALGAGLTPGWDGPRVGFAILDL
jgi:hypothetical protein